MSKQCKTSMVLKHITSIKIHLLYLLPTICYSSVPSFLAFPSMQIFSKLAAFVRDQSMKEQQLKSCIQAFVQSCYAHVYVHYGVPLFVFFSLEQDTFVHVYISQIKQPHFPYNIRLL